MRDHRPFLPLAEMRFFERILMANDIAFYGKVSDVDLDLPSNNQAIFCVGPLTIVTHCHEDWDLFCPTCVYRFLKLSIGGSNKGGVARVSCIFRISGSTCLLRDQDAITR